MTQWFDSITMMSLENHGWSAVQNLKFFDYIAKNGTVFTNWTGAVHPSGPNYRTWLSGQTWSQNEYDAVQRPNLGQQLDYRVIQFKNAAAVRHNPFLDMNPNDPRPTETCTSYDDTTLKPFTYLGLDDLNNAHSANLDIADSNVMEAIGLFEALKAQNKLFVIIFDEAYGLEYIDNHVFAGMLGTDVPVQHVSSRLSHYNLAQFFADNFGLSLSTSADPRCATYAGRNLLTLP